MISAAKSATSSGKYLWKKPCVTALYVKL